MLSMGKQGGCQKQHGEGIDPVRDIGQHAAALHRGGDWAMERLLLRDERRGSNTKSLEIAASRLIDRYIPLQEYVKGMGDPDASPTSP